MASENSNSLSKQEAIEQLRQTIRQLETITEQLEDTSVIDLPSSTSIQNLIATATELERIIAQKSALQDKQIEAKPENSEAQLAVDNSTTLPENPKIEEDRVITPDKKVASKPEIRIFEPASANREITKKQELPESKIQPNPIVKNQLQANKGKRTLIGIAAALLLIVVPLSWKLFLTNETPQLIARDTPKTIVQPATEPVVIPTPVIEAEPSVNDEVPLGNIEAITNNRAENILPATEPVIIPTPVKEAEPSVNDEIPLGNIEAITNNRAENIILPATEPIVIPTPVTEAEPSVNDKIVQKDVLPPENIIEPETNLTPQIPSRLVAENKPRKLAIETIDPNIQLTPEQNLIAALESKTNNLASRYNDDLVISIKPDFTDNIVVVTVADRWYEITTSSQDKIVSEMLKRSRSLEFDKLKITDSQNNLIARSPVIGEDMIVLRRTS